MLDDDTTTREFPAPAGEPPLPPGVLPPAPGAKPVDVGAPHAGDRTLLEDLRAEVAQEVTPDRVTYTVATRPSWAVQFRTDISDDDMKRFRKQARLKSRNPITQEPDVDELKVCKLVIATYAAGVYRDGVLVEDSAGDPLTLAHPEFLAMCQVATAADAVTRWYGTDGAIVSTGRALMAAAGYVDEPDMVTPGPTPR